MRDFNAFASRTVTTIQNDDLDLDEDEGAAKQVHTRYTTHCTIHYYCSSCVCALTVLLAPPITACE
jgi:hypothetical protein